MTPIGHFASSAFIAGNIDLLEKKETIFCFSYYFLFLVVFYFLTLLFAPGPWAMYLHDWFGNAALLFFLIFWIRKDERRQYFVCLLIGSQILSAYTHAFDVLWLKLTGAIPEGMWRPHNILHTPLAALAIPLIVTPVAGWIMKNKNWARIFFYLTAGYFLHIICDTITYNFQIYPVWPLSDYHFSLVSFFQQPDAVSSWLGNPLYVFSAPNLKNIDGFIVYRAEVLINLLLMMLYFMKIISGKILPFATEAGDPPKVGGRGSARRREP